MSETRLFPSERCAGYFGTKRFDRPKKHMISAAALLEIDFERSLADYSDLMKLANIMTNGNRDALEQMYRIMCFNVFADNQDDHLKNFSFLFNESMHIWELAPAYDLTCQITGYGEHTTTVNGKGKQIEISDLVSVGASASLSKKKCIDIAEDIRLKTEKLLKTRAGSK